MYFLFHIYPDWPQDKLSCWDFLLGIFLMLNRILEKKCLTCSRLSGYLTICINSWLYVVDRVLLPKKVIDRIFCSYQILQNPKPLNWDIPIATVC